MRRVKFPVIKQMRFTAEQGAWLCLEASRVGVGEVEIVRRAVDGLMVRGEVVVLLGKLPVGVDDVG